MPNLIAIIIIFFFVKFSKQSFSQVNGFTFNGFKGTTNLTLTEVAKINNNGVLQLTNETSRLKGHAFYPSPLPFKNSSTGKPFSFSTTFAFAVVPEYPKLGGHGLAFTVSPSPDYHKSALPSQYLGLLNASDVGNFTNHLFAVEFDTVQDFEFGDINDNHVGIDINSLQSNKSAKAEFLNDDSVMQDLNLKSGKMIFAWIDYNSLTNLLNVTISPFSSKPKSPILSYEINLSLIFQENMYVGFSASTGLLASSHYIMGWCFEINGDCENLHLSSLPSLPSTEGKKHKTLVIIACVLTLGVVIALISVGVYVIKKIKNGDVIEDWEHEIGPHRYSYQELKKATRGFRESELLGHGGFGKVYKGTLPNSKTLAAVKRVSHESNQGLREFVSEISTIGRLRHRNLVQLLGWCRRRKDLLLVYEFMANGSLDNFLFGEPKWPLNWDQRFHIIKGVASGLLYLHEGYEQIVIHRDVKASNVLIDVDLNGKLGDFGLARLHEHGSNPGTTRIVGTLGYLAPELPRTGRATTMSDVYAFGALLLEVVSGRRPIEPKAGPDELVLVDWMWENWRQGRGLDVVDRKLEGQFDANQVMMVFKLGLMCSNNVAKVRPNMRQVLRFLEGEVKVPEVVRAPNGYDGEKSDMGIQGFDDYVHSYVSSTFDNESCYSFPRNEEDLGLSFATISSSTSSIALPKREQ